MYKSYVYDPLHCCVHVTIQKWQGFGDVNVSASTLLMSLRFQLAPVMFVGMHK